MARRFAALTVRYGVALLIAVTTMSCGQPGPGVIHYDSDACDHCRMTISDARFAAQLVTRTGQIYRFDDPGCLEAFLAAGRVDPAGIHSTWVNDHAHPDRMVSAGQAVFVVSDRIRAPMNGGMAAFAARADAARLQDAVGGELRAWSEASRRVLR
jgi:copper chaperone NosL